MCAHGDRRRTRRPPVTRLSRSALLTLLPPTHPTHSPSPLRRELQAQRPPVGAAPLHRCAHEKRECADGAHWSLSERGSGGFGAPPHRAANGARATRGSHGRLRARALCDCGGAGAGRDRRPLGGSAAAAKPAASRSSARRAPPPRARPPWTIRALGGGARAAAARRVGKGAGEAAAGSVHAAGASAGAVAGAAPP